MKTKILAIVMFLVLAAGCAAPRRAINYTATDLLNNRVTTGTNLTRRQMLVVMDRLLIESDYNFRVYCENPAPGDSLDFINFKE